MGSIFYQDPEELMDILVNDEHARIGGNAITISDTRRPRPSVLGPSPARSRPRLNTFSQSLDSIDRDFVGGNIDDEGRDLDDLDAGIESLNLLDGLNESSQSSGNEDLSLNGSSDRNRATNYQSLALHRAYPLLANISEIRLHAYDPSGVVSLDEVSDSNTNDESFELIVENKSVSFMGSPLNVGEIRLYSYDEGKHSKDVFHTDPNIQNLSLIVVQQSADPFLGNTLNMEEIHEYSNDTGVSLDPTPSDVDITVDCDTFNNDQGLNQLFDSYDSGEPSCSQLKNELDEIFKNMLCKNLLLQKDESLLDEDQRPIENNLHDNPSSSLDISCEQTEALDINFELDSSSTQIEPYLVNNLLNQVNNDSKNLALTTEKKANQENNFKGTEKKNFNASLAAHSSNDLGGVSSTLPTRLKGNLKRKLNQYNENTDDVDIIPCLKTIALQGLDVNIYNVLCTFNVGCHPVTRHVAMYGYNVEYKPDRDVVRMKLKKPYYAVATLFANGRVVSTGTTNVLCAKKAARCFARNIGRIGYVCSLNNFKVVDVFGSFILPFGVRLVELSQFWEDSKFNTTKCSSLTLKLAKPKAKIKVLSMGKVIVASSCEANVLEAAAIVFPKIWMFRKEHRSLDSGTLNKKQDKAKRRKLKM